jgi:mannonate dehydratase
MKIALHLPSQPNRNWTLARQIGVEYAVTKIPQQCNGQEPPWALNSLLKLKAKFEHAGLKLILLEGDQFNMQRIKLGQPGREEDLDRFCELLGNMGKAGIDLLCYNFMAQFGWLRTSVSTPARGGALASSFDYEAVKHDPPTEAGIVADEILWDNYTYFIRKVLPAAEDAGVRLALHPDDPPISPIRGMARIFRSVEAFWKALEIIPSEYHGVTFCQATFSAMGGDLYETIRSFGAAGKLFFVHFRNIRGLAGNFTETFHEEGQIDMTRAMRCYRDIGFDGPIRPDHTPTLEGEDNSDPGYAIMGRVYAVGYMKGLIEAQSVNE